MSTYLVLDNDDDQPQRSESGVKSWLRARGLAVLLGLFFYHSYSYSGKPAPLIISTVSGLINGMLMFSFAAVFASLVFENTFPDFAPIGLNMFTGSAMITGIIGIATSKFLVGIVGPGTVSIFVLI